MDSKIPKGALREAGQVVGQTTMVKANRATFILLQ